MPIIPQHMLELNRPPENTLKLSDFRVKAIGVLASVGIALLAVLEAAPEIGRAQQWPIPAETPQKDRAGRAELAHNIEELRKGQRSFEATVARLEQFLASLLLQRKELDDLAKQLKDMPDSLKYIAELRAKLDAAIIRSDGSLKDAKAYLDEIRLSISNAEKLLRESENK